MSSLVLCSQADIVTGLPSSVMDSWVQKPGNKDILSVSFLHDEKETGNKDILSVSFLHDENMNKKISMQEINLFITLRDIIPI